MQIKRQKTASNKLRNIVMSEEQKVLEQMEKLNQKLEKIRQQKFKKVQDHFYKIGLDKWDINNLKKGLSFLAENGENEFGNSK